MASLDSLPADQRAVLQLVLQRGRTYDEIAKLLSIDRAAVRQRALTALDELGPQTGVPAERRAVIADYLLGQLPAGAGDSAREGMAHSPSERAWARIVASELSDIATEPLPAIPAPEGRSEREGEAGAAAAFVPAASAAAEPEPAAAAAPSPPPEPSQSAASRVTRALHGDKAEESAAAAGAPPSEGGRKRATSRRGGALLIGLVAAAVIAVVVVLLVTSGGSSKHNGTTAANTTPTATTGTGTTTGKGTTSTTPTQVLGQINLTPPTKGSKTAGIAEVLRQGSTKGIAIVAQKVPKNTKSDAYAVWLYNSPSDAHLLGFVNPGVTSNGRLSTAGALPTNASRFKQLIVTRETQATPKQPGTIILQGQLAGLS